MSVHHEEGPVLVGLLTIDLLVPEHGHADERAHEHEQHHQEPEIADRVETSGEANNKKCKAAIIVGIYSRKIRN